MAFIIAKMFTGLVFLLASLLALWHVGAGGDVAKGKLLRLLRLTMLSRHGDEHRNQDDHYELSKCEKCLAEGSDFCISGNECIPRATLQCRGPYDHITGDKEFSLRGNPDGIQHSMSCPSPRPASKSGEVNMKDHAKVDWAKIKHVKAGFFARLKHFKEMKDPHGVKKMMARAHHMFHEAGMPEDGIDYKLLTWVKSVFPESLTGAPNELSKCEKCLVEGRDFCISGNECIPRATFQCRGPYDHITGDKEFSLRGNPDGIQHSMSCPSPRSASKSGEVDMKDCYFDKECHAKVDWAKIKRIKAGFFARLKHFKKMRDPHGVKEMMGKVHHMFHEAGMPDDRIDYILLKWVKSVFPESLTGAPTEDEPRMPMCVVAKERCTKDGKPVLQGRCGVQWKACEHEKSAHLNKQGAGDHSFDEKDCYFDKECHSMVDWESIGKIKRGFFMRLKFYKKTGNKEAAKKAMDITHGLFQKAGVPDDRIDYILNKWVKYVYPEVLQSSAEMLTV